MGREGQLMMEPADSAWWQVQCGFSDDCPPGRKIGHFQISTFSTVSTLKRRSLIGGDSEK
jgi:hypothetical protein